jgi:hypothetical protein
MISCGVSFSLPAQNGQELDSGNGSCFCDTGRLARSVAIITHRPTIGSLPQLGNSQSFDRSRYALQIFIHFDLAIVLEIGGETEPEALATAWRLCRP